ncbi:protein MpASLBD5 [Marchantia polymorpha subsp. ruderalis]
MSHTGGGSSPSSPCGACRLFRWKCTAECVFAPYFPAAEALKFAYVHEIFKASKVIKILHDLPESIRADAMTLLAFDAEARMKEHGWMFHGCALHRRTMELQEEVPELREQINYFEDREQRRISQGSSECSCQDVYIAEI